MCEHTIQLCFDASCRFVQCPPGWRPEQDVQAHREHTLVTTLQRVAQALRILEANLALGIADALGQQVDTPRGLQLRDLQTKCAPHLARRQRPNMHAELQRDVELLYERRKPAGGNRARITGHHQHSQVMRFELQVIAADLGA